MFGDTAFEWPREGTLAIKVGRASFNGVEAKRADVTCSSTAAAFEIDRLSVGDLGGAAARRERSISIPTPQFRAAP